MSNTHPLTWDDFEMATAWLAYEITGNYYMDKKSFNKQPPNAPFHFLYREPITLYSEERGIFMLFIRRIFREWFDSNRTQTEFNSQKILKDIVYQVGLPVDYSKSNSSLGILCRTFTDLFPEFVRVYVR